LPLPADIERVDDDEFIYRRIPMQPAYYDPHFDSTPSPLAFKPIKNDTTGVSVSRALFKTPAEVARNERGKRYYVAKLRVGDLRRRGIRVEAKPIRPHDLGHAEITSLTWDTRKTQQAEEFMVQLAHELVLEVLGPLP
jgi:hypothetical protein